MPVAVAFVICLLGAESATRAALAEALAQALAVTGRRTALVPAQPSEPADAAELVAQVDAARWGHEIVVVHQPAEAGAALARTDLTLLLALDPATASPAQRQLDAALRSALLAARQGWSVIGGGTPSERLQAALAAHAGELRRRRPATAASAASWRHACGRCGDPDCERHSTALARHG
ncbi:MAG: hypothetical protein RLY71_2193 [Pseudomonadota bacterium]|jgi:hypothetical protein